MVDLRAGGGSELTASAAQPEALSTLNEDGSRKWIHPRVSPGRFLRRRRVVAYLLLLLYNALPWIDINGKPSILLDLPRREFTFFGTTFLPTDTLLLMLFVAGVFVAIFLVTALFGRLWCGWACPQTVYMEFVYRPIERLFDGPPDARGRRPKRGAGADNGLRTIAKYAVYLVISLHLAHTFLAYFVGAENLFDWTRRSPFEHPTAFLIVAATTGLMMFDFCVFREQTCIVACPYGRLQSVLLDRSSLIIGYDERRGEPRGRSRRAADVALPQLGDCVDCSLCVTTCPTGIDIRRGLQMECVGCAQCIDACDAVMTKLGRATGLIRYSSQDGLQSRARRRLRPRVVLYPALLVVIITAFVVVLVTRSPADITLLRTRGAPYTALADGAIANDVRVKIVNRTEAARTYVMTVDGLDGVRVTGEIDVAVEPGATRTALIAVVAPRGAFDLGKATVRLHVSDDDGFTEARRYRLQGPWNGGGGAP